MPNKYEYHDEEDARRDRATEAWRLITVRCVKCGHEMEMYPIQNTYSPCPKCGSALPKQTVAPRYEYVDGSATHCTVVNLTAFDRALIEVMNSADVYETESTLP